MLITTTTPTITEWKCKLLVDNYLFSTQVINSVAQFRAIDGSYMCVHSYTAVYEHTCK